MKPVIFDCDPGHDDAIALFLAIASDKLDVKLITVCGGNQTVDKTALNVLKIIEFLNFDVEVCKGAARPLIQELLTAEINHGVTGLDGPYFPPIKGEVSSRKAIEAQASVLRESNKKVTLICTAPLTNIGLLLSVYPELKEKMERIIFMGGACFGGNWTPKAEYNTIVDPHAAKIVVDSGIPITMCGLDVTNKAQIYPNEIEDFRNMGNKTGKLLAELLDFFGKSHTPNFLIGEADNGLHLHDVCAVAWAIAPELFVYKNLFLDIETSKGYGFGSTVVDYDNCYNKKPNADICFDIDREAFVKLLFDHVKKLI
ncbi:MAG: nucleoside hydrolase [Desulfovibrionales bacterium]|nr:nucleoside hydrolase [Desulfovibrionales bacterium]